jgi:Xaa-Pro aminopeptidase
MSFLKYMAPKFFGAFLFLVPCVLMGQEFPKSEVKVEAPTMYDNDLLTKEFHTGRREALRKLMDDSTVAVFFSSPIKNRSNDVDYEFHQDPNFYYLTGLHETDAMILVFKNEVQIDGISTNEILFLKERAPNSERWTGKLLGTEGAKNILGIESAYPNTSFSEKNIDFSKFKNIYFIDQKKEIKSKLYDQFSKNQGPNIDALAIKEMMGKLREIKLAEELVLMRKAITITCDAISEAMKALEPTMNEFNMEAIVEYVFKAKGAEHEGYPSIVGGGDNSCILHYETNRKKLTSKDMVVCDVGAEYHGYTADVTRSIPVSGKFSPEQKAIYNIVLEAQMAGIDTCKPGADFRAPHKAATAIIQKRLLELGVIKAPNEVGKYFFHGTSHYLGLDVHDMGSYGRLKPNSVITVEPGIYIPLGADCDQKWWGIGIRIEDDILITEGKPEVLSDCVPKTIEEIEALMKKESLFNLLKK